jgi:predicted Zn-dependent protease with MMP-like domain
MGEIRQHEIRGCRLTGCYIIRITFNHSWIEDNDTTVNDVERDVILHEFGHALGLGHEHYSPSREGKLTLNEEGMLM